MTFDREQKWTSKFELQTCRGPAGGISWWRARLPSQAECHGSERLPMCFPNDLSREQTELVGRVRKGSLLVFSLPHSISQSVDKYV